MKIFSILVKCIFIVYAFNFSFFRLNSKEVNAAENRFVEQQTIDTVKENCSKPINDEMDLSTFCKYSGASIDVVYEIMLNKHVSREIAFFLKKSLPTKNLEYNVDNNENGIVSIAYKYKNPKEMIIEIQFEGGIDTYKIIKQKKDILLTIIKSAD